MAEKNQPARRTIATFHDGRSITPLLLCVHPTKFVGNLHQPMQHPQGRQRPPSDPSSSLLCVVLLFSTLLRATGSACFATDTANFLPSGITNLLGACVTPASPVLHACCTCVTSGPHACIQRATTVFLTPIGFDSNFDVKRQIAINLLRTHQPQKQSLLLRKISP